MKIKIVAVGKLRSKPVLELVDDYAGRIGHYFQFEHVSIKDEKALSIGRDDFLIVCDENGKEASSKGLSDILARHQMSGTKSLLFYVGDARGVGDDIKKQAKLILSLSRMTFPHELARLILFEQVYRACTILRNEKYHYA